MKNKVQIALWKEVWIALSCIFGYYRHRLFEGWKKGIKRLHK